MGNQTPPSVRGMPLVRVNALSIGGIAFMLAAFVALVVLVITLYSLRGLKGYQFEDVSRYEQYEQAQREYVTERMVAQMIDYYSRHYLPPLMLLVAAILASFLGYFMLRAAGTASKQVIPQQDYELLSKILLKSKDKAIDHYVRLSSLTGMTGVFTKVGLSGLPLATIVLTIGFTLLAFFETKMSTSFFDLAKLTLGAFLGSYVQRRVSEKEPTIP